MSPAIAIAKREVKTYFYSPIPYLVAAVFIILTGFFCFTILLLEGQAEMRGYFGGLVPWLLPILIMMVIFGGLIVLTKGSAIAPFIYTLF